MTAYRRLFVIAAFFLCSLDASSNVGIREACTANSGRTRLCLEASLQYRCMNYGNFSLVAPGPIRRCNESVTKLLDILDLVQVPVSKKEKESSDDLVEKSGLMLKQVLFARDLREIFRRPETAGYFEAALLSLQDSVRFGKENNLWDSMYTHSRFNRTVTLKIIGQAIQDVSFGMWHMRYLDRLFEKQRLPKSSTEIRNLHAAGEFIVLFQETLEQKVSFSPYPSIRGLEKSLHPYLHHFYLPAYLASELSRAGKTKEAAFFAGFLLNTGYEFVKLDAKVGDQRWPFHDPKKFSHQKYELQARKIYTGYVGALWGVGLEEHAMAYDVFAKKLAADPYGFMRTLFETAF